MVGQTHHIRVQSLAGMQALGADFGRCLRPGVTVGLYGPIGAGKSAFSRAVIQGILGPGEEVPSPTFTLVQTYDTPDFEIWHADLYRLTSLDQVDELGLWEAFEDQVCLVEWPEVLENHLPTAALKITIAPQEDTDHRTVTVTCADPDQPNLKGILRDTYC